MIFVKLFLFFFKPLENLIFANFFLFMNDLRVGKESNVIFSFTHHRPRKNMVEHTHCMGFRYDCLRNLLFVRKMEKQSGDESYQAF